MKRQFIAIIALFLFISSESEGQILPFTHYTPDREINALPSAEVHKVFQDRLGYIWFAIYSSGLVRYNGVQMETYGLDEGLRDLTVWDLIEDPSGRLWVSSNAGLVVSEEPLSNYEAGRRIKFVSKSNDISIIDLSVNHNRMTIGKDGWLWVGTENIGVVKYRFTDNNQLQADTLSTDISGSGNEIVVRALTARMDGSIWVSLLDGNLLRFEQNEPSKIYNTDSEEYTNVLYEDYDGRLWGGDKDGRIWQLTGNKETLRYLEVSNNLSSNIANITSLSDSTIWISSEGSGLQKIDPKSNFKTTTYNRSNGLLSEIVFNVFEDAEQNIWVAQSGGVSKLRYNYKAFKNLTASTLAGGVPVLPSPSINTILPTETPSLKNPCIVWAGTSEGGISCVNENFKSIFIQQNDGLTGNWVNGLVYDSSERLWIGTSRGLNSISFNNTSPIRGALNATPVSLFNEESALLATHPANSILAIQKLNLQVNSNSQQKLETLWFPAYHEIYVLLHEKIHNLDSHWGLPAAIFHAVALDSKGYLWVGTRDRGIYRSKKPLTAEILQQAEVFKNKIQFFESWWSTDTGAPTNQIDNLLWHDGKMWVGTTTGLIALDESTKDVIHRITTRDGLLADNATSIALSPVTNTFWIGTNQGLAEIDPETGTVLQTVTKADGLVDNEVWFYGSVQIDSNGTVYFGTAKGVSIYYPSEDRKNNRPPVIKLTNSTSVEVPGERNEFSFEYAALSFGSERQVRYQTRLLGFNDEWSPEKRDTRVNYTNLPAYFVQKTYTLEVRAVNESGVWSTNPLSYNFAVTPVWWLSWWAALGYMFIFGVSVFSVDRYQRSRLLRKEREEALLRETELKAETAIARSKVAEAQAKALQAENELKAAELEKAKELGEAYHELKSTQKRLIQAEKMASLGRLSTGIAHEIKNPLNFITNFAELSKELVEELHVAIENNDTSEIDFITENLRLNTNKIEEHGKRADAIVRSMMQHSRGGAMTFEMTDLNGLVIQYSELAYHSKSAKNPELEVAIVTELEEGLPPVNIISRQIGQVLQNILENAFDAIWEKKSKSNGIFTPQISISTKQNGGEVEIRISDNGPGIPEAVREKIFEPFFTTKPTGEGTGLGLSISYDIITQIHNGSLKVEGETGQGTSFIISLPLTESWNPKDL